MAISTSSFFDMDDYQKSAMQQMHRDYERMKYEYERQIAYHNMADKIAEPKQVNPTQQKPNLILLLTEI